MEASTPQAHRTPGRVWPANSGESLRCPSASPLKRAALRLSFRPESGEAERSGREGVSRRGLVQNRSEPGGTYPAPDPGVKRRARPIRFQIPPLCFAPVGMTRYMRRTEVPPYSSRSQPGPFITLGAEPCGRRDQGYSWVRPSFRPIATKVTNIYGRMDQGGTGYRTECADLLRPDA